VDARLRASRGARAHPRLCSDARGRDGGVRQVMAAGVRRRKIAPSHADKSHMDTIIGAPLGLGVLLALGGILIIMAYLSE
jgi:hypothetical protein